MKYGIRATATFVFWSMIGASVFAWPLVQQTEVVPDAMATALAAGDTAYGAGNYVVAVEAYSSISPIEIPVVAQNRLGVAYLMLGMEKEAEATFRVATARERGYAPTHNNLGALYYARGDFGDAEDRFRDSLDYDATDIVAQANLHAAKYARENRREVQTEIERRASDNPLLVDGVEGEILKVTLLIESDVQEELRLMELRGDVFVARKMFDDAIVEYERYLELDEFDAMVVNKLGITYQQAQRVDDAEDSYRRALRLNPYFVAAYNNLGSLEHGRGNYRRALDYYRRALEIEADSSTVLQNLGACLFAMERYEEGLLAYIGAIRLDPGLFDRLAGRGGTLVQTAPGNEAMTNFYLAKLFAGTGDLERTMSFLYRAVEEGFDDAGMLNDPVFNELRSDERFVRLIESFG